MQNKTRPTYWRVNQVDPVCAIHKLPSSEQSVRRLCSQHRLALARTCNQAQLPLLRQQSLHILQRNVAPK